MLGIIYLLKSVLSDLRSEPGRLSVLPSEFQARRWGSYLLDGAEVGIPGHGEVQIDPRGQQEVNSHTLVLLLGPEFHGAVNPRGHSALSPLRPCLS